MGGRRRRVVGAACAAVLVLVGAVTAALINELHGGWLWWVLAGAAALLWAIGSGALYFHDSGTEGQRVRVADGGVYAKSARGGVHTRAAVHADRTGPEGMGDRIVIGSGAVFIDGDIDGPVWTDTVITPGPPPDGDSHGEVDDGRSRLLWPRWGIDHVRGSDAAPPPAP